MCSIIKLLIFPDSFQYMIAITGSKDLDFGKKATNYGQKDYSKYA